MTSSTQATASEAKGRAADVKDTAAEQAANVTATVKDQTGNVVQEASSQARNLLEEARGQVREQTAAQRDRITALLSEFADELEEMAGAGGRDGLATEVVRQVASRARTITSSLGDTDGGDALDTVRTFARRRPGMFLLAAGLAGVVAGRAARTAKEVRSDSSTEVEQGSTGVAPLGTVPAAGLGYPDTYAAAGNDLSAGAGMGLGTGVAAGADRGYTADPYATDQAYASDQPRATGETVDLTVVEVDEVEPGSENEWAPVASRSDAFGQEGRR